MKNLSTKRLFYLSIFIAGYFGFLYLNYHIFKIHYIIIGFIMEMITIPLGLAQVVLLVIAFQYWRREKFSIKRYSFWAFLILFLNSFWTIGSFLISRT